MVQFADLDKKYGFAVGTLASLYEQETSSGRNVKTSGAGAKGHMQFLKGTRDEVLRETGIDAYGGAREAADAAGYYLNKIRKQVGGSDAKALAAYNAGAGTVLNAVKKGGSNWLAHMPAETRKYVPSVLGRLGTDAQEVAGIADFSRRYEAGQTNEEENARQAQRNRELLEEGGINTSNMTMDALLGKMFMALFGSLIEGMIEKAQAASLEQPASKQGEHVADGTAVTPNAPPKTASAPQRNVPTPA